MSDTDIQVDLFRLELEIHEAACREDLALAAELRTEWFKRSLEIYNILQLIEVFKLQLEKWREASEQAIPEAIKVYSKRLILVADKISAL